MPTAERNVRQQLMEARADIERQIEILQAGPLYNNRGGVNQFEPILSELTATLKEIEERLAELGKNDA